MKITQAVLPVAGLGTRFLPWTKVVPKELLPLGNQPVIAYLVNECLDIGIDRICFVISRGKELIPQYFADNPRLEEELQQRGKTECMQQLKRYHNVDFHVVYQEEQLGDGHALLQAADWVENDYAAVVFGDDLLLGEESGLQQLKRAMGNQHVEREAAIVALEDVPRAMLSSYGIVEVENEHPNDAKLKKLKNMVEKPSPEDAPSTLGVVGRYIVPRSLFGILPKVEAGHGGEIRLIDALIHKLKNGSPVYGYTCSGTRFDTGTPEGYKEALNSNF